MMESYVERPLSNSGQPIPLKFTESNFSEELYPLILKLVEISKIAIPLSYTTYGYSFVLGIELFLGFLTSANKNWPESKRVYSFDDLETQTFISFFNWAMKKDTSYYYWLKAIRVIFDKAHNQFPKEIKKIVFPNLRAPKLNPRVPLTDDAVNQLLIHLKKNIDAIVAKQDQRDRWLSEGKVLEISKHDFVDDFSLANICYEYKNTYSENFPEPTITIKGKTKSNPLYRNLLLRLKKCPDKKINQLSPSEFQLAYKSNNWSSLADTGRHCINAFRNSKFLMADAAKTVYESDYIFSMDKNDLIKLHAQTCKTMSNESCETNIHLLIRKFRTGTVRPSSKSSKSLPLFDSDIQRYTDFLAELYPTPDEVTILLIFIMLQTGWNLETALRLDINDYEHSISRGVDSEIAVLKSIKRRGGNNQLPYLTEKEILAPSDIKDKYSTYNLYQLLFRITKPFRHGEAYLELVNELGYEPAFIYLLNNYSHKSRLIDTIRNRKTTNSIKSFLLKNPIYENGDQVLLKNHLLQRLRPTWERLKKKQGGSRASLTYLMGHENSETKDIYYDNRGVATADRKERGGSELREIAKSLKDHSFKGKLVPLRTGIESESKKPISRDGHVFLDDYSNRLISLCNNSLAPDWDGYEKWVDKNTPCVYINKCLMCSQARITVDTLPYLVDRSRYIDSQELILNRIDFIQLYADEKSAVDFVLSNWPNHEDVDEAEIYVDLNGPLLPSDMQIPMLGKV